LSSGWWNGRRGDSSTRWQNACSSAVVYLRLGRRFNPSFSGETNPPLARQDTEHVWKDAAEHVIAEEEAAETD
jgi:hypothetical protein